MKLETILVTLAVLSASGAGTTPPAATGGEGGASTAPPATPAPVHFALSRSVPAAGSEVAAPSEVRLWFTEVPQEGSMSIRLLDPAGEPLEAPLAQDAEDGRVFFLSLEEPLPPGAYTVGWRAIGQDGHVVRGDFGFTVTAR